MPKIPESGWRELADPESEDYAPSASEIDDEQEISEILSRELYDIEDKLERPTKDPYTGEENKFRADDPEFFWSTIAYLKIDYLNKIKDLELRKKMKERILKIEQKIYKQFIPFIESKINIFGFDNSPLEKYPAHHKINIAEITAAFAQAQSILESLKISQEEQKDFLSEISRLKEKLERYQLEPTLFTFENIEEKLQKEVFDISDFNLEHFDLLLEKARYLNEIAGKMSQETNKFDCEMRAKFILNILNRKRERESAKTESGSSKKSNNNYFKVENTGADWAWKLLGVEKNSSKDDIRNAYRALALKYHPDVNKNKDATEKMKQINEAFRLIKKAGGYK